MKLIARSQPRERVSVAVGQMWKEYRVRKITDTEFYAMREAGIICRTTTFLPYVIEDRYFRTDGDLLAVEDWRAWNFGKTAREAIDGVLGDTDFLSAESLAPIHRILVERTLESQRLNDVSYKADQLRRDKLEALNEKVRAGNQEWEKKSTGVTDANELAKITRRLQKKYQGEIETLKLDVDEARDAASAAKEELEKFEKRRNRH